MNKRRRFFISILVLLVAGCSARAATSPTSSDPILTGIPTHSQAITETAVVPRTLTVYAAASLSSAFNEIGMDFETAIPGVKVEFNFAGSQILRTQLEQGAGADVFAPADHKNMDILVSDSMLLHNSYQDFATNKLVVILPASNPGSVQSIHDLAKPGLKLVLADASVPAGNYARQVLARMSSTPSFGADFETKVLANVVSNETDVKQAVAKVELGEADAGIVYSSDAVAAPNLLTIPIPDEYNIIAKYPIAVLSRSPQPDLATAFVNYILSPAGQSVLNKWGFMGISP